MGLGDVVSEVLGKFVVLGALLGALASSKDLAEGNSDGTPPGPLVGRLVSVAVGAPLGARLDGIIEGYEDDTLGLVEGRELAVGARERIFSLRRTLGPACATLSSVILVTSRPKPPETAAAMPIVAATVLPPTITTVVFRRRRGVDARIIALSLSPSCGRQVVSFSNMLNRKTRLKMDMRKHSASFQSHTFFWELF